MPTRKLDPQDEKYQQHGLDNVYSLESGTFHLPIAIDPSLLTEDDSPVVVVRAFVPYRVRTVTFKTRKSGTPPIIPSPESVGSFEFLGGTLLFNAPTINVSGQDFNWSIGGTYAFVETIRSDLSDGFVLGQTSPVFSTIDHGLSQVIGAGNPTSGAIANTGLSGKIAYAESMQLDVGDPVFSYMSTTYFPGQLLNNGMINANAYLYGIQQP